MDEMLEKYLENPLVIWKMKVANWEWDHWWLLVILILVVIILEIYCHRR